MKTKKQDGSKPIEFPNVKMFFFGDPKIGKTTEASGWPGSLIVNMENRTGKVVGEIVPESGRIDSIDKLTKVIEFVKTSPKFKTVVFDGFTSFVIKLVVDHEEEQKKKKGWSDKRLAYREVTDAVLGVLAKIMDLDKIVIFTGHAKLSDTTLEYPKKQNSQYSFRVPLKIAALDLPPRIKNFLEGSVDLYGYVYAVKGVAKIRCVPLAPISTTENAEGWQYAPKPQKQIDAGNGLGLTTLLLSYSEFEKQLVEKLDIVDE